MRHLAWYVFLGSLLIHLLGLNQLGRTWDEPFKVDTGYVAWDNLFHARVGESDWTYGMEHPPLAKYIYGSLLPPHLLDITPPFQIDKPTYDHVMSGLWISQQFRDRLFMVQYDLTLPRILSALASSLAVTLTYLLATSFASPILALAAPLTLVLSPRYLVMGQLITFESLSVLATVALVYYALRKRLYLALVLAALSFWVRYSNLYSFLLLALVLIFTKQKLWYLLLAPVITFVIGLVIWPLLWHEFPHYLLQTFLEHQTRGIGPSLYIIRQFLVTTPEPILLLSLLGLFRAPSYVRAWFFSALIFFSLASVPTGGTRYAIALYPALALLCVSGLSFFDFRRLFPRLLAGLSILYLVGSLLLYSPYYLDYYNLLLGGVKGAASRGLAVSWWGEGQREAALYLKSHVQEGDTIALYVTPQYVFPTTIYPGVKLYPYNTGAGVANYLVVSRDQENSALTAGYDLVYSVTVARSVPLVQVYRLQEK